jgi:hypothetical protein
MKKRVISALLLIFALAFVGKVIFLASSVKSGIFPDEDYHWKLSEHYRDADGGMLENDVRYVRLGTVAERPWFYHYMVGVTLHFKPDGVSSRMWSRGVNVIFSAVLIVCLFLFLKSLLIDPLMLLLGFGMGTNLLMFDFISAGAGYDPLTNLLALLSIWSLVHYYRYRSMRSVFAFAILTGVGALTKISYLPIPALIGPLFFGVVFFQERRGLKSFLGDQFKELRDLLRQRFWLASLGMVGILAIGTLYLYGGSMIKYGTLSPTCTHVYTDDDCKKNGLHMRGVTLSAANKDTERKSLGWYATNFWGPTMVKRVIGILAHKNYQQPKWQYKLVRNLLYFFVLAVLVAYFMKSIQIRPEIWMCLATSVIYTAFLMIYVNYRGYLWVGKMNVAIQGRYLFPVLGPFLVAFPCFVLSVLPQKFFLREIFTAYALCLLISIGFPQFYHEVGTQFFE